MKSIHKWFAVAAAAAMALPISAQVGSHRPLVESRIIHLKKLTKGKRIAYKGKRGSAIVLFDTTTSFGYAGDLYGQQLANLLTHFDYKVTLEPIESYKAGDIQNYDATFYLGYVYDNPLPTAFKTDVMADAKPFCWCGFNLWQIAWTGGVYRAHSSAFTSKTGMQFMGLDESGYGQVAYKGQLLQKDLIVATEGVVQLVPSGGASVDAWSQNTSGGAIPYMTQGAGNFWYVADNPMMGISLTSLQDRVLAFGDALHDILKVNHAASHNAFVRIEDVSAACDPVELRAIGDVLSAQKVPFEVMVVPEYMDPLGAYNNGVPQIVPMIQAPAFVAALKYMEKKGGQIVMHGLTHQYSNLPNPYTAVTADDYEFYRVVLDANGNQVPLGPVPEDSPAWIKARIKKGLQLLSKAGFSNITGWNTPHYMASQVDYDEIAGDFDYVLDRGLTFSTDPSGTTHILQQFSPFTFCDEHGIRRMPETIGYIDPTGNSNTPGALPADLEVRAHANLVVRDGWAGCYFHPFLPVSYLKDLVTRVKSEGYKFVKTSRDYVNLK